MDIVDKKTRSRMMSGIKGKDTKAEILIRKKIYALGYRYRLHYKKLPGKPDIVLPKYKAIIQINGCFWHGHNCHLFRLPKTNTDFWKSKIESNVLRDERNMESYIKLGWKCLTVWECALKGKEKMNIDDVVAAVVDWINNGLTNIELSGGVDKK